VGWLYTDFEDAELPAVWPALILGCSLGVILGRTPPCGRNRPWVPVQLEKQEDAELLSNFGHRA
jgi:hypothetical protein